jgi:hypothetical protein
LSHSTSAHVQQLYTGFKLLSDCRLVDVSQTICKPISGGSSGAQHLRNATHAHLRVELTCERGRKLTLYFDNHDSKEIDRAHLDVCDVYFKRSFSRQYISETHPEDKERIFPLGLNYLVLPDDFDSLSLRRSIVLAASLTKMGSGILKAVNTRNLVTFHPRLRTIHSLPIDSGVPRVIFIVTAYDPHDTPDRSREKVDEFHRTNEFRASCVRILRKELGREFYGGFVRNRFTAAKYKDVLIDNPNCTKKGNYLRLLEQFPICVATTGLHGSIGWKLAEYVAFSKAILSEPLQYEIPGSFEANQNYLEFSTPEELVERARRLLGDRELRNSLMMNNAVYYHRFVRPDMLVFNALCIAMKRWMTGSPVAGSMR